jgi:hypothetical protein
MATMTNLTFYTATSSINNSTVSISASQEVMWLRWNLFVFLFNLERFSLTALSYG